MRRQFPKRPILCVGAVVIKDDKVVLIRRRNNPQRGEWTIPGGAVELDERIMDAVRREVREETRLWVEPRVLVAVFERIVHKQGRVQYHYVVLDYACKCRRGRVAPASDVLDARWVPRSDVTKYGMRAAVVSVIQQAFDYLK